MDKGKDAEPETDGGWRVTHVHRGIYTGGKFDFAPDGKRMFCMYSDNVAVVDNASGRLLFTLMKTVVLFSLVVESHCMHSCIGCKG